MAMEDVNGSYGYSTGGYTIAGLKNIQNKTHELYVEREDPNHETEFRGTEQTEEQPRRQATHRKYSQEMKDEIVRLRKEERMPRQLIAEKYGITVKAVEHILYDRQVFVGTTDGKNLSEKELKWFEKHFKHTRNEDIMKKLSITHSTLHRYARELGLTKSKAFMKATQEYASKKAAESHEKNGTYPPKGYQIPNSNRFKKGEGVWVHFNKKQKKEHVAKCRAGLVATIAREKRRVLYGFEQETKLRVVAAPRPKSNLKCNMRKKYGYIVERGKDVIYYDSNTVRKPEIEKKAIGFGFEIRAYEK